MNKKDSLTQEHKSREIEQNRILFAELEQYLKTSKKRRRSRMEIYYDILWLIQTQDSRMRPTNIQLLAKTSYDKLTKYLAELEKAELIMKHHLSITEKGKDFLRSYDKLIKHLPKEE